MDVATRRYSALVNSNKGWEWNRDFAKGIKESERSAIRQEAINSGLIPKVNFKPGTKYADFEGAGLVSRVDYLPKHLWKMSSQSQETFLNGQIPGGKPKGYTWHHSENPGRMELVPLGVHNAYDHVGGRAPGHWAYREKRK
jgi:A nuclease of the HNH/ENDO VII superfamily with conserved WHH